MNAVVTIRQTFDLETRGETVCRVEAGATFGATAENGRVWFWVTDESGRLHKATLPTESELIEIKFDKQRYEKNNHTFCDSFCRDLTRSSPLDNPKRNL